MKKSQADEFKTLLLETRSELMKIDETLAESGKTVELDQTRVGRLSRMDAMQGQQMALETARRHKQKLVGIATALRRIEDGSFGNCLECDEEINIQRLYADPSNEKCIECAD